MTTASTPAIAWPGVGVLPNTGNSQYANDETRSTQPNQNQGESPEGTAAEPAFNKAPPKSSIFGVALGNSGPPRDGGPGAPSSVPVDGGNSVPHPWQYRPVSTAKRAPQCGQNFIDP